MTETVAIIIGVISACGACGAGLAKYCSGNDSDTTVVIENHHEEIINRAPHNTPVPNLEELIAHQMEQRDSDTSTEIDIKINIHTVTHDLKEANDGKHYK